MPITDYQRKKRKDHIGASDSPAILGLTPQWRTAYDVYIEKTMELSRMDENDAIKIGNLAERGMLDWAAAELNAEIVKNQYRVAKDGPGAGIMAANCDALLPNLDAVLEAKTSGVLWPTPDKDQWGDSGTDLVPDHVTVQVHHQMLCAGARRAFVAALIGGIGLRLYEIARNDALIDAIAEQIAEFWQNHVQVRVPPSLESYPSVEILKRIQRVPEKVVTLDSEIAAPVVARWEMWTKFRLAAEKAEKQSKAASLALLGDAEGGMLPDGRMLTYMEQERKGYTVAPSKSRVARIKKAPNQITQG